MAIPRCEHGVYSPDGDGKPSEYCSGCVTPSASLTALNATHYEEINFESGWFTTQEGDHVPVPALTEQELGYEDTVDTQTVACPVCWVPLTIADEYDFECSNCGFNGL